MLKESMKEAERGASLGKRDIAKTELDKLDDSRSELFPGATVDHLQTIERTYTRETSTLLIIQETSRQWRRHHGPLQNTKLAPRILYFSAITTISLQTMAGHGYTRTRAELLE
jgi:hypothetical protein